MIVDMVIMWVLHCKDLQVVQVDLHLPSLLLVLVLQEVQLGHVVHPHHWGQSLPKGNNRDNAYNIIQHSINHINTTQHSKQSNSITTLLSLEEDSQVLLIHSSPCFLWVQLVQEVLAFLVLQCLQHLLCLLAVLCCL